MMIRVVFFTYFSRLQFFLFFCVVIRKGLESIKLLNTNKSIEYCIIIKRTNLILQIFPTISSYLHQWAKYFKLLREQNVLQRT